MTEIYSFRELIRNSDKLLMVMPVIFAAISLVMVGSTEYNGSFSITRDIIVQFIAYVTGGALLFAMMNVDYLRFERIPRVLYGASILLMLLVYTPIGIEQYGSRAWLNLGFTTVQPCEFVKVLFTLWFAGYLSRHREDLQQLFGLLKAVAFALPIAALVALEDLGNALVILFMMVFMIFFAGVDIRLFLAFGAGAAACSPLAYYLMADHQRERIDAFLHPSDRSLSGNYQVWNSKIAIGSGGMTGKGLFQGTQKSLNYLPVAKSDFIFSVIGEEFGLLGGSFVIALYTFFLYRLIRISMNAREMFGHLVVTGITAMFFFQIFENIGMTMGIMPVTGITLPFISYGGTSVVADLLALGLVFSVGSRNKIIHFT